MGPVKVSPGKVAWKGWIIATMISGVSGFATTMTYVHGFIYPRTEAEVLEKRVSDVEQHYREDLRSLKEDIKEVHVDVRHILDALIVKHAEAEPKKASQEDQGYDYSNDTDFAWIDANHE